MNNNNNKHSHQGPFRHGQEAQELASASVDYSAYVEQSQVDLSVRVDPSKVGGTLKVEDSEFPELAPADYMIGAGQVAVCEDDEEEGYSVHMEENAGGQSLAQSEGFCKSVDFNSDSNESDEPKESERSLLKRSEASKLPVSQQQQQQVSHRLNSSSQAKKSLLLKQSTDNHNNRNHKRHKLDIEVEELKNEAKGSQRLNSACHLPSMNNESTQKPVHFENKCLVNIQQEIFSLLDAKQEPVAIAKQTTSGFKKAALNYREISSSNFSSSRSNISLGRGGGGAGHQKPGVLLLNASLSSKPSEDKKESPLTTSPALITVTTYIADNGADHKPHHQAPDSQALKKVKEEAVLQNPTNKAVKELIEAEDYSRYAEFDVAKALKEISILSGYSHIEMLSQNKISEVHLVTKTAAPRRKATLKIVDLTDFTEVQKQLLRFNLNALQGMHHPNIVKVESWMIQTNTAFILSEYVEEGELLPRVTFSKQLTDKLIASVIQQILEALQYASKRGVYHLDLKPENLLVEGVDYNGIYKVKIADIGLNKFMGQENYLTYKLGQAKKGGTPYYYAPEIIQQKFHALSDVWSVGAILHTLFSGYPPFMGVNNRTILNKIGKGTKLNFRAVEWKHAPASLKHLIQGMMTFTPDNRLTLQDCLEHPWLRQVLNSPGFFLAEDCFNNLRVFVSELTLQSAISSFLFCREEKRQIYNAVEQILTLEHSESQQGWISANQLISAFELLLQSRQQAIEEAEKLLNTAIDSQDLEELKSLDPNDISLNRKQLLKNGIINLEDPITSKKLHRAFRLYDIDCSDTISTAEIQYLLSGIMGSIEEFCSYQSGARGRVENLDQLVQDLFNDTNRLGDGMINFPQFKQIMYSLFSQKF